MAGAFLADYHGTLLGDAYSSHKGFLWMGTARPPDASATPAGSAWGGDWAATHITICQSCLLVGLDPYVYRLPAGPLC